MPSSPASGGYKDVSLFSSPGHSKVGKDFGELLKDMNGKGTFMIVHIFFAHYENGTQTNMGADKTRF